MGLRVGIADAVGKVKNRGRKENAISIIIFLLILLGLSKFIVGLVFFNNCPAENRIPQYIAGSGGSATVIDAIVACVEKIVDAAEDGGVYAVAGVLVFEHTISIIYGSYYVFLNYAYISGGCDGAEECCDQNFIKFALGVLIIEWIIIGTPIVCMLVYVRFCSR